jgi:hypothetical protein
MPKIKILPIVKSLIVALFFFVLGRLMVMRLGTVGIWIVAILVIGFYAIWWVSYQRGKQK